MTVRMIWAEARNRVIGNAGTLPWHLPEDLRLFRERTLDATVVMGRATWESLPERVRPLPGRRNVVLTRNPDMSLPGAEQASSVQEVLDTYKDFWVIGGAKVYAAFAPHATQVLRTRINLRIPGDTRAPRLGPDWKNTEDQPQGWTESESGLKFRVEELVRADSSALEQALPEQLSQDEARIILARSGGVGGGYTPTRVSGGWLFTPPMNSQMVATAHPWLISDAGECRPMNRPARSISQTMTDMG